MMGLRKEKTSAKPFHPGSFRAEKRTQKVFVAMSGGVDSSVAAALLKRDGLVAPGCFKQRRKADVVGVYMKCWTEGAACTAEDDERAARLAAAHLQIPFYVWNFVDEYRQNVVDYMLQGYEKGSTPNPDIMCNKEIKFGLFFEKARKLGADYIATGHYARLRRCYGGQARILEAVDKNKDQSYFLSFIRPEVLPHIVFPIGDYTKLQVRELAKKFGLPNAERKESQGICFVGKVDFTDFLKEYLVPKKGEIVDTQGKVLGTHEGVTYYTVGQRHNIRLSGGPYYVKEKDIQNNRLVVSKDKNELCSKEVVLRDMNWFYAKVLPGTLSVLARIRYRQKAVPAQLFAAEHAPDVRLVFDEPQRAVTPGQFAVLYQGENMLGGGVIV